MRHSALFLSLLFACQTTAVVDGPPKGNDSGNDDDAGDTGVLLADVSEGEYAGEVVGVNTYFGTETDCEGPAEPAIDADGSLAGYLTCTFPSGYAQEGDWAGTEADGAIDSVWTNDIGNGYVLEFPGVGDYADGEVVVDFDWEDTDMGVTFVGTATLTRL